MHKILFDLNASLKINEGANFEEICNMLQNFTPAHLYIDENQKLRGVDNVTQVPYGKCTLMIIDNGFVLREDEGHRTIRTFSRSLMEYLTTIPIFPKMFSFENNLSLDLLDTLDSSISSESEVYIIAESSDEVIEPKIVESSILSESSHIDSVKESTTKDSSNSSSNSSSTDIVFTEFQSHDDHLNRKQLEEALVTMMDKNQNLEKTYFRFYLKSQDDDEGDCATYVNPKLFVMLEEENDIDLEETIAMSFRNYLVEKGYHNPQISIFYREDVFAELLIETDKHLSEDVIDDIENDALLSLYENIIYFKYREVSNVKEIYADDVPIERLPVEFLEVVLEKMDFLKNERDSIFFTFEDREFAIKGEGGKIYSVLDYENYFNLSHLHYIHYPVAVRYEELPIAQFYHH